MYFSHIVFLSVRFRILEKIDLEIWYIRLRLNFNQQRDHRDGRVENVKRGVETGMDWFYSFFFCITLQDHRCKCKCGIRIV